MADRPTFTVKLVETPASRYSKTGNYHITQERGELLPDGRVIVGDCVFSEWGQEYCR